LLEKIGRRPQHDLEAFIIKLSTASVATRYPDDLGKILQVYTAEVALEIIAKSKEVLQWIKKQ
jgi:HEPN domain-containing protein